MYWWSIRLLRALQALFPVVFRSNDSSVCYSHWTYVLLGVTGSWLSGRDESPCMESDQTQDTSRWLFLSCWSQLSLSVTETWRWIWVTECKRLVPSGISRILSDLFHSPADLQVSLCYFNFEKCCLNSFNSAVVIWQWSAQAVQERTSVSCFHLQVFCSQEQILCSGKEIILCGRKFCG